MDEIALSSNDLYRTNYKVTYIPGRKVSVPSPKRPYAWDLSPPMWPVKTNNERIRRMHPNTRRKTASPIDFHGILSEDSADMSNRGSNVFSFC